MVTGTVLMTERRQRKGVGTAKSVRKDAQTITEMAEELIALAEVVEHSSFKSFDIDGHSKLQRGLELVRAYVQRVDEGIALARVKSKYDD